VSLFGKILIANRGEIACRVVRTARRLGIATVAVYSEADRHAMHVELADEAWPIGPPAAQDSYLNISAILAAARNSGAEAVHPGYGFLSENAEFAEACAAAGVVFIGPPASAIRAMGSKAAAKTLMHRAGVPLVPGYHGEDQDPEHLADEAERTGFPVLIKAAGGGGGKGMRVVAEAAEFGAALAAAKREAAAAFADDRMLIEKYLPRARHIEIQIFADSQSNAVHLFERECSIQRRHQKLVEEAPSVALDDARRSKLLGIARKATEAIGYRTVGTHEFLLDEDKNFYFMEMNTRIQVEHTVTEEVFGLDLVREQMRLAAGDPLKLAPDIRPRGHAIELRINAEDPVTFAPSPGRITALNLPGGIGVRVDTHIYNQYLVPPFYDSLLAKLIVRAENRPAALARLRRALAEFVVEGCKTNLDFFRRLLANAEYVAGKMDTHLIERM